MNECIKTSTLLKSIYTNYQENRSLYNINNKKRFLSLWNSLINLAIFISV